MAMRRAARRSTARDGPTPAAPREYSAGMTLLRTDEERRHVAAVARLADLNPFLLDTRSELERQAAADVLGPAALSGAAPPASETRLREPSHERDRMQHPTAELAECLRGRLLAGERTSRDDLEQYQALVLYVLFNRYQSLFEALIARAEAGQPTTARVVEYRKYEADHAHFLRIPRVALPNPIDAGHLFAWGFQLRRAYYHTFRQIIGTSGPAAKLRATVWESIFTHDRLRYRRALYDRMADITTLILGESGTGKELVARAIGLSRYVPFDQKELRFAEDYAA
jgi:hypothetical protein